MPPTRLPFPSCIATALVLAAASPAMAAAPAMAQVLPADPSLTAPLPDLPDLPPIVDLPPPDFGDPIVLPDVAPPDADLLAPLPPLATFNPAPRADFTFTQVAENGVRYTVRTDGLQGTGLENTFRRLSSLQRGAGKPATAAQIASRANSDTALMERLLNSEGWYDGTSEASVDIPDGTAAGGAPARADITLIAVPGERYHWRQITLDLVPEDKLELSRDFELKPGDPIRAIAVEEAEGALLRRLLESGYPFAEIGARDVVLDADAPTGTYLLTGDIGPAGIFGDIRMSGFQPFDEEHAEVIARFEPGQPFDARLVDDFRRALIATQQFGGVTVSTVDTGLREPDGRAVTEIRVVGNRGPQRLLTGQIGYSTGEGFRAEALWRHRALFRPEGMLTARAVAGTQEQRVAVDVVKSNFRQRDRTLAASVDIANLDRPAYRASTATISAGLSRASTAIWQKRWTWSAGFELQASDERERAEPRSGEPLPEERRTFFIAALPTSLGYDRSDDLLDPTSGFRLRLELTPEISKQAGNVETYGRAIFDGSAYRGFGEKFVLAGRTRLGSIMGADLVDIAPTRRLYSGGGGSVRGFEFQGVGPLGVNDRPTGGRGLFEASIEGRYRFGAFGVVGFVDAGSVNAGSLPSLSNMRYGAGVGGRYYTSFGPIRIDVARAINRQPRDPKVALYISIGQAF